MPVNAVDKMLGGDLGAGVPQRQFPGNNDSYLPQTQRQTSSTEGSMPVATIIGAVIAAGTAIVGGIINSQEVDEANKIGMQMYNQERQDKLALQKKQDQMNRFNQRMARKQFKFQEKQFEQGVKERAEDRGYAKRQNYMTNNLNMVNQNAQLRSVFMNTMTRR